MPLSALNIKRGGKMPAMPSPVGARHASELIGTGLRSGARAVLETGLRLLPERSRLSVRTALGRVQPWEPGARLAPPRCPEGMETGAPHFVGVGAQKAGTTWWYELLAGHPGVYNFPGAHKERHFFMRFFDREFGAADAAEYHRWFPRPPGRLAGEWTPDYMLHFWIPRLLRMAAPDTRLLVLLRDPVERMSSGLTHVATRQPVPDARAATEAYLRGRYFEQLLTLRSHFDADRILVQQYEKCRRDTAGELGRTFSFLGLPALAAVPDQTAVNPTVGRKVTVAGGIRNELVRLYRPDVEHLLAAYPDIDVSLWPNFAFLAR